MKKLLIIFSLLHFFTNKFFCSYFKRALLEAYKNNPELNAERENIKI